MAFILIYVLICFHIKQIQNAPSPNINYEIDDFIDQLMTSEKFNVLADVIAERAAIKMKMAENSTVRTLRHSSISEKSRKKKSNKEKHTITRDEPVLREKKKEKSLKQNPGKFGEINTKAFLKNGESSRELFLNYKHITEELKRKIELKDDSSKTDDKKTDKGNDDIFSDHSTEQLKKSREEDENKERKHFKTKSRIAKNTDREHSTENNSDVNEDFISNKTTSKKSTKNNKSSQKFPEDITQLNSKEASKSDKKYKKIPITQTTKSNIDISMDWSNFESRKDTENSEKTKDSQEHQDNKRNEFTIEDSKLDKKYKKSPTAQTIELNIVDTSLDSSNEHKNDIAHTALKTESHELVVQKKESQEMNDSSKEIVEVGINRAFSDSSEHRTEEKLDLESRENLKRNIQSVKNLVRSENGKSYTFISSSDYDEYHENVARHKSRNM